MITSHKLIFLYFVKLLIDLHIVYVADINLYEISTIRLRLNRNNTTHSNVVVRILLQIAEHKVSSRVSCPGSFLLWLCGLLFCFSRILALLKFLQRMPLLPVCYINIDVLSSRSANGAQLKHVGIFFLINRLIGRNLFRWGLFFCLFLLLSFGIVDFGQWLLTDFSQLNTFFRLFFLI